MSQLMRCPYCGLLQDEPAGVKECGRCGGELVFEQSPPTPAGYVQAQMELDQINAPGDQIVERHLVITLTTPSQVPAEEAAPTESGREPMGFVAVLDVSGSMRGEKIVAARDAVRQTIRLLHDGDVFSLVTFASRSKTLLKPAVVDARLRARVESVLQEVEAGGQTALYGGLEKGLKMAQAKTQDVNLVLLLSDGQANVGETDLEQVGARALEGREHGITVSTLGVGRNYNEALMAEVANQGGGRFYHILHAHQIAPYLAGELGEASALAARDTELHLALPAGTGIQPFSGAYRVGQDSNVLLGDIPIDTQLEVVLRLLLPAQTSGSRLPIDGELSYRSPAGNDLATALNTVTVRYTDQAAFGHADGAVIPVVERVLEQIRARNVLGSVRMAATHGKAEVERGARTRVQEVRRYASLLGEERAEEMAAEEEEQLRVVFAAPAASKAAMGAAYQRQRSTRSFDKT